MSRISGVFGQKSEENQFTIEDAIVSSAWCTRRAGYEAAAAEFRKTDLRGKNWELFIQLVKTLTAERNVPALEKGLEAVLAFVENCSFVDDDGLRCLLNNVVKNGLANVKPRIKDLANQICMALYDRKKHDMVTDMLLQGMETRNSKHAFSCIRTLTNALTDYGPSYVNTSTVAAKAVDVCQDKAMFQQDVKDLLREIYKWNGPEVKERCLKSLDAPQRKAMEIEFSKVDHGRAEKSKLLHKPPPSADSYDTSRASRDNKPKSARPSMALPQVTAKINRPSSTSQAGKRVTVRLLSPRSQRFRAENSTSKKAPDRGCGDRPNQKSEPSGVIKIDLDDIFIMMVSKQWGERKEALEELYNRINSNKIINAVNYGKMIKRLRVLILEDTNVVLVAKAIKCVTALAKSQSKEFQQHVPLMMTLLLEKFKEKKSVVIESIREAIDAIYLGFNFAGIARYVALSLVSSNPSVKAETSSFVQRCYARPTNALSKVNHWQPLVQGLVNNLTFPDQVVRENAMKALGTISKVLGNGAVAQYLKKIPKHQVSTIFKYSNNVEVFMRSASCTKKERSADICSDSDEYLNSARSASDYKPINPKVNSLLPGFKAQATGYQLSSSSDESEISDERESNHRNNRQSHANRRKPSSASISLHPPRRKSLSPAARQRLIEFQREINNLKQARKNDQDEPLQLTHSSLGELRGNSSGTAEEKITRKLQELEGTVSKSFMEIRQLSPQLYEELEHSGNQSSGDVIRTLNQRLYEMERLMKSMTFEICPY